jgi:large subunit ribosomal protein L28
MARACEICGKSVSFGNMIARRGMAKYLGGVGVKITGVSRRKFLPNVQKVRIQEPSGTVRTGKVCTRCLKTGRVRKPTRREIPENVAKATRERILARSPEQRRAARRARRAARKAQAKAPPKKS